MTTRRPLLRPLPNPYGRLYKGATDGLPALDHGSFHRLAHHIWDLRPADDEQGGYVVARKREERAVDLRKASALCPHRLLVKNGQVTPVTINIRLHDADEELEGLDQEALEDEMEADFGEDELLEDEMLEDPSMLEEKALAPGEPGLPEVAAPGLEDEFGGGPVDVLTDDGEAMEVEPEMLVRPESCPCIEHLMHELEELHGPDPQMMMREGPDSLEVAEGLQPREDMPISPGMNPMIGPSSQMAAPAPMEELVVIVASFTREAVDLEALGEWVQPTRAFSPAYMGGTMRIDPDEREVYKVEGVSPANPQFDRLYGIPNPMLPHPNANERSPEWALNNRVRLTPYGGGEPIFITPTELDRFFTSAPDVAGERMQPDQGEQAYEQLQEMPGEPAMMPETGPEDVAPGYPQDVLAPPTPPIGRPSVDPFEMTNPGATHMRPTVKPIQPRSVQPQSSPGSGTAYARPRK